MRVFVFVFLSANGRLERCGPASFGWLDLNRESGGKMVVNGDG